MRIGIDFDNTIVSYDALFRKVARERDLVPIDIPVSKIAVRNHLRCVGKEELWTELQGYIYGARMDEASAYPGVVEFIHRAAVAGHEMAIISHKTKHPFLGPKYDLHAAARSWVEKNLCLDGSALIPPSHVFFELTKEEKLARVDHFGCDVFIDDLPEILLAEAFPGATHRVLFDPEYHHSKINADDIYRVHSWDEFDRYIQASGRVNAASTAAAALLARVKMSSNIRSIETCNIGGNNQTYKIETADSVLIAKRYFRDKGDIRDRMATEFAFLSYADKMAPGLTPRPIARDEKNNFALYEFIDGQSFRPGDVTIEHVDCAADFFCALNASNAQMAAKLPVASEACFSVREHIELVDDRLNRLLAIAPQDNEDHLAKPFFEELYAKWQLLAQEVEFEAADIGLDLREPLPDDQKCISPSDFGFHNALRKSDGTICFLDFEYAGWDDPGKMAGDFFSQLAVPVPGIYFDRFVEKTMRPFPDCNDLIQRARLLRPVYQIKWCCIALNVYLPVHLARRKFANPELDAAKLKQSQFIKAKNLFQSIYPSNHVLH